MLEQENLFPFRIHLIGSFILRMLLIAYGEYQDARAAVKFTDVDYRVFTDASRHVLSGNSPYERHTYRYTPLLAWMLIPNLTISPVYGKVLFCCLDIFIGMLIYDFIKKFSPLSQATVTDVIARIASFLWLYNPLVFTVSARGNAESVVVLLVILTVYLFKERVFILAGLAYGIAVHFKIYPIIYSLSFYMALSDQKGWLRLFEINQARIRFVIGSAISFVVLSSLCYYIYGDSFLEEAYLYHIWRKDIRHNFSPYFYMLYLTIEDDDIGINLLTFVPQTILLLAFAHKFATTKDLPFCLFCQTVVFVAYNKVITSQYFLWYLCLLPLSLPKLQFSRGEAMVCLLIWGATQASWLLPAYYLEFQGTNTFQVIWVEGLAFFTANIGLLSKFVRKYREVDFTLSQKYDMNKVD